MGVFFDYLQRLPGVLAILTYTAALSAEASLLEARSTNKNTTAAIPAPIAISANEYWDGIDGSWSSFTLRVGTPAQNVRVFLSTASYQTWVVLPQGCDAADDVQACEDARGWIFDSNNSTTFDRIGIYDLWIEQNLAYYGNAIYGYDAVGLGGQGEGGPTLTNTTVGTYAVEDFYLGVFGVNPKPTNFTDWETRSPSYMTLLKEQKFIPSVSFGYTAGAKYQSTGVLASLTLGGYDSSKFHANNVTWTLAADNERDIMVAIQSVTTPSTDKSSPVATELLPTPIFAYIDSTVPQIWLPVEACVQFEAEFGLVYDNDTNLYLVNDTLHEALLGRNANVSFSLGTSLSGGPTVQITLPYAAFDLTAKTPYQGLANNSLYFPLRRAQNATQYTLGRTFLQEAYLSVNWESAKFNVSQVSWNTSTDQHLVAMLPHTDSSNHPTFINNLAHGALSREVSVGTIVGAVVGGIVTFGLLGGAAVWWALRRKKRQSQMRAAGGEKPDPDRRSRSRLSGLGGLGKSDVFPKAELEGSSGDRGLLSAQRSVTSEHSSRSSPRNLISAHGVSPVTPTAGNGTCGSSHSNVPFTPISPMPTEADSREVGIFELVGDLPEIREKDGKELNEKEALAHRERIYNGVHIPPHMPPPDSAIDNQDCGKTRRIFRPEEIIETDMAVDPEDFTVRRPFSFEMDDKERKTLSGETIRDL